MIRFKFSRRIGSGGMGDVFLALQEGLGGFEKLVVVKRIHPELTQNPSFVDMFLNEARVVAAVRHPNVVEILDIQRDANGLFIVLEYLSGETIHYLMEMLAGSGDAVPYGIACRLVADVAQGLHGAHTTTDNNGELLGIVHRDVTPSNVIVGYNGVAKILDFGVAAGSVQRTGADSAAVGKIGYQAPEQIAGLEEDARTDVFQLAICLHEMLCGKRLFGSDDEHEAMLNLIERAILPPSHSNPGLPKELDDIVMRALTLDWDERTATAEELGVQLETLLEERNEHISQKRVAEWMHATFAERYEERVLLEREIVSELRGEVADPSELPEMFSPESSAGRRAPVLAATRVEVPARVVARGTNKKKQRGSKRIWFAAGVLAAAAATGLIYSRLSDNPGTTPRTAAVPRQNAVPAPAVPTPTHTIQPDAAVTPAPIALALRVEPANAAISIDGVLVGTGRYAGAIARDGTTHALSLSAPGYKTRTIRFRDTAPPELIALEKDDVKDVTTTSLAVRRPAKSRVVSTARKAGPTTAAKNKGNTSTTATTTTTTTTTTPDARPATENLNPWQNKTKTDNKDPWK